MSDMIERENRYFDTTLEVPAGSLIDITPLRGDVMRLFVSEGFGELMINERLRGIGPGDVIDQIVDVTCVVRADPDSRVVLQRTYI
jgi:hypothetical protein